VYWHPTARRNFGLLITARARCCSICVSNWCVAATDTLQGSAGRKPTPVEKTLGWSPSLRSCFPTLVYGWHFSKTLFCSQHTFN
jgi:hypothetical protein